MPKPKPIKKVKVRTHERTLAPKDSIPVRKLTLAELFRGRGARKP